MAKSQWSFETATGLAAALAKKEVSAIELVDHAIARIERHDARINAVCVRDFDRARDAARAADAARGRGETRPLLGIPMTVKESFNLAGTPTTWGIPPQKDFMPKEDALAIQPVKTAGGVILAKTNVPLGLGDWQSYNDIYGTTNNPLISRARPADRPADRPRRSRPATARCRSARIWRARCACRPFIAASSRTNPHSVLRRCAATRRRRTRLCRSSAICP